ncbi:MAG: CBS domain-containing protein [Gemmatimonadales bacterium]
MTFVQDVMTTGLVVVSPELSLRDLVELLVSKHVGGAPVVRRGKVVGVVTLDDVASFQASVPPVPGNEPGEIGWNEEEPAGAIEGEDPPSAYFMDTWADVGADLVERTTTLGGPEWDLMGEHIVEEVMSRKLLTIGPQEPVEEAARRMDQADVHRLIVTGEGDRLLGIITTSDITRAVAQGRV